MSFWTDENRRTILDDAEDLAYPPTGGLVKMWLMGCGLASLPIIYGMECLIKGQARFFGKNSHLDLTGRSATALAIAYISLGLFMHAHWFWGINDRLEPWSNILKLLAVLGFLVGFGYCVYAVLR